MAQVNLNPILEVVLGERMGRIPFLPLSLSPSLPGGVQSGGA